jgi:DNA-binding SARP family transcriptional activator
MAPCRACRAGSGGGLSLLDRPHHGEKGASVAGPPTVRAKIRLPQGQGLPRERLDRRLDEVLAHPLTLVVAPPGSGKTTLLGAWAAGAAERKIPVAWYRAESTDGDPATFLAYLQAALADALGVAGATGEPGGWASETAGGAVVVDGAGETAGGTWSRAEDAAAVLERLPCACLVVVIDDLHALAATPAEALLDQLLDYVPPSVHLVCGTRSLPTFDVSRRRVSGQLLEITGDDLRFRPWEIEGLFRDFYGESLRPDELTRLARRTEGWAAGLQLFHLATRDRPPAERLRLLEGLGRGSVLVREYLARNVLDVLPDELRRFLVDTCVLRRLSPTLCDDLRGSTGSARLLEELVRREVFTVRLDDAGTYRYHEVLRSHLEGVLVDERGEAGAREWAMRAGTLLEREGAVAEALAAYCRASAPEAVARILGAGGEPLARGWTWLDTVPAAMLGQDPWLMLGMARRLRSDGQWRQAVEMYRQAEASFGPADPGATARAERIALAAFLEPVAPPIGGWQGGLRSTVAGDRRPYRRMASGVRAHGAPAGAARRSLTDTSEGQLVAGLEELVAGRLTAVPVLLEPLVDDEQPSAAVAIAAWLALGTARVLRGDPGGRHDLDAGVAAADAAAEAWLGRLGRALLALAQPPTAASRSEVRALRAAAEHSGDPWGGVLGALIEGWVLLDAAEDAGPALEAAADGARQVGASALEAWARSLGALAAARAGQPGARAAALRADSLARANGITGARYPVHLALARADPSGAEDHLAAAEALRAQTGLRAFGGEPATRSPLDGSGSRMRGMEAHDAGGRAGPGAAGSEGHGAQGESAGLRPASARPLDIRLFGGFSVAIHGRPLDLAGVKPRPRALFRLLAAHAGRPIHREALSAAFWPDADPDAAGRNLNVALSALRRELTEPDGAEPSILQREGDAYRLVVPPGGRVDLLELEAAVSEGRSARSRGARDASIERYRDALAVGVGELLPEDGPAEWAVELRDAARRELVEAAQGLAELLLDDDPGGAAAACEAGLRIDAHHDPLWRLLIEARQRAGDRAAASSVQQAYERMLERLGLAGEPASENPPRAVAARRASPADGTPAGAMALTGGPGTRPR